MNNLGWFFCIVGTAVLLIAALGVVRLPDALSRQHAATKAATFGVSAFALGAALGTGLELAWAGRLLVLVVLLLLTLPIASMALGRAAVGEQHDDSRRKR